MKKIKKIIICLIIFCFLASGNIPLYAYTLIPEFLCETGLKLYRQGNIEDAMREFNKALLANPNYKPAREYIHMIYDNLDNKKAAPAEEIILPEAMPEPLLKKQPEVIPEPVVFAVETIPVFEAVQEEMIKEEARLQERKEAIEEAMSVVPDVVLPEMPEERLPEIISEPVMALKQITSAPEAMEEEMIKEEIKLQERKKAIEEAMSGFKKITLPLTKPSFGVPQDTKELFAPQVLMLDESIKAVTAAFEIEQGKSIIISGHNIQRFLLTQPEVLNIQKRGSNELLVTAENFGYTFLHIWDDNDRWTLEFLTVPLRPQGPTYEDILRRSEERANAFKFRYSMDWNSFYTSLDGTFDKLKRSSYSFGHYLYLNGPTPYGDFDSSASIRKLKTSTDLSYFTLGLTKGKIGPFEDFSLRGVDFSPSVTNLALSAPTLRGAALESPAFHKALDYTIFWGREGGGRFGDLSPGLTKIRNSFLSGLSMDYSYNKNQKYGFSTFSGWGRDRPATLNDIGYDAYTDWKLDNWDMRYELAYDSEKLAHLFTTKYEMAKLKFTEEIRNIDKSFVTMTGSGWRVGELGSLTSFYYSPLENLNINGMLDMFQDRLFPNPKNLDTWNTDFRTDANLSLDPLTNIRLDYSFLNDLGKISPFRSLNTGLGLYKTFEWLLRINTYLNYRYQADTHFTSTALNYTNEKVAMGLRFGITRELYYFLNREINWLDERSSGNHSRPGVFETGIDWNTQILKRSPLYSSMRLLYHKEENTASPLSFLSGEDYLEGYGTLSYKPQADQELYCSSRIRKIWPADDSVAKRLEADFNAGFRYLWDTGLRWEPIGVIEGYVFKDLNSDGIQEDGDQPLEGIRLWLAKKSATTDSTGYYKFINIRARKAYVNLDTQTLPAGFVLTVPVTQEAGILNHRNVRLDFGVISRSEIWGIVFLDVDGDGAFNISDGDKGIKGAVLILENGLKAVSDGSGQYRFSNVSVGEHTVALDLNTLAVEYLPIVPLKKDVVVFEGVSYNYNIPVKSTK